jgi:type IV pilus assembly protein PilQ
LNDVDIQVALEAILKLKGLTYIRDNNILRIMPVSEVREEDLETRVFSLGYASSKDVLIALDRLKGDRAKVSVDNRMNAVIIKDLSQNIDRMEQLLKDLDSRVPQILIEAKIVEMASNYSRELGIQWGGMYTSTSGDKSIAFTGGTTGASSGAGEGGGTIRPSVGSTTLYPLTGDIGMSGNAYIVNLPAAVGSGSGGALGITFGKVGKLNLDLQLSAMQSMGSGKILSNPKILTMNNKEATVSSGTDIPVRVLTTTTVGTTGEVKTISATLMLSTTPIVTRDNRIALAIKVEKSEPDFSQQVDGIPTITRRSATAELIVEDGETIVLGGIYVKNEGEVEAGIPLLSDIPLLGWLFKKKTKIEKQGELLIFITPAIVQ